MADSKDIEDRSRSVRQFCNKGDLHNVAQALMTGPISDRAASCIYKEMAGSPYFEVYANCLTPAQRRDMLLPVFEWDLKKKGVLDCFQALLCFEMEPLRIEIAHGLVKAVIENGVSCSVFSRLLEKFTTDQKEKGLLMAAENWERGKSYAETLVAAGADPEKVLSGYLSTVYDYQVSTFQLKPVVMLEQLILQKKASQFQNQFNAASAEITELRGLVQKLTERLDELEKPSGAVLKKTPGQAP